MSTEKPKYTGAVRAVSVEVRLLDKAAWKRLLELTDTCREITNCAWQTWLVEHVKRGTGAKLKAFLQAKAAWHESKEGTAPKWEGGYGMDAELSKLIYRTVVDAFPQVTPGSISAFLQIFNKRLSSRKASNGNLPGWWAILLCRESLPSSTRAQPIPIRAQETELRVTKELDQDCKPVQRWSLSIKANREGFGCVINDVLPLIAGGYKTRTITAILERIKSGEWKLCGSSLIYSAKKNKWFAAIGYQRAAKVPVEGTGTAFIRPASRSPWRVRIAGRSFRRMGTGEYVATIRQRLLTQRWSRQANYRYAGSANKGHGRARAMLPIEKLSERWKDFTKTANQQLAAQVVAECVEKGVGTLIYLQPRNNKASRFLETAGKVEGREDSTGWDWYQFGTLLASKCEELGVHFVRREARCDKKAGDRSQVKCGKGLGSKKRKAG